MIETLAAFAVPTLALLLFCLWLAGRVRRGDRDVEQ